MTSKFGDYFDHISDIIKIILLYATLYNIDKNKFSKMFPFVIFLSVLIGVHMGCQEIYHEKKTEDTSMHSESLHLTKSMCPADKSNVEEYLPFTKIFGCGTYNIAIAFLIIYFYDKN